MTHGPRYALYFAPAPDSLWWDAGCRWVGRDPVRMTECPQPSIPGIPARAVHELTSDARRYGFHATLKAPFRLAPGFSEPHLTAMAEAFCSTQKPVTLEDVQVHSFGGFLALRPSGPLDEINALAMRCVSYFDLLRAAPGAAELARRHRSALNERQAWLLQRWGYPYVDDQYRFHMTLCDSLAEINANAIDAIREAADQQFAVPRSSEAMTIDALSIFREDEPGAPFSLWRRIPFDASLGSSALPAPGRLFYFVGPSGVGKDTLLQWVRERMLVETEFVFARRTITRPAHASEAHDATDEASFLRDAADGRFALTWQANGLRYGVPRGIEAELEAGRDVIVNGSREHIPQLLQRFPDAVVIWVDADDVQLRQRLEARQRESGAALQERMARARRFDAPKAPQVICLDNSGPVEVAGRQLLDILTK